jgi:putative ABC transport system permease protein
VKRVTLRSLWEHKRRLLSTVLAVVLGVAFMSGTFIMSTTLDQSFNDLFSKVVRNTDAVVQGKVLFTDLIDGDQHANLPQSVVDQVRRVRGVAVAEPRVTTEGLLSLSRVLGKDGKTIGGSTATTVLESWLASKEVSPYRLTKGRAPKDVDEMVLNDAAAADGHLGVGDTVTVVSSAGPSKYELVGTFAFGAAKSVGGNITAAFTLPQAQHLAGLKDEVQAIFVKADKGISEQELVHRISPVLKGNAEAITGQEAIKQLSTQSTGNFKFLKLALVIFGAIALLVGTFVISNTFSILVTQRTKELALLRALGAGRGQVLGSVLLEAGLIGAVAAVIGIGAGLLLAHGILSGISATGVALPNASVVVSGRTIVFSMAIGVAVTLLASLLPALRATQVAPLAALRDVAVDRSNLSRFRIGAGIVCLSIGCYLLSAAWRSGGSTSSIPSVGVGAGLAVIGFLVVGPVLAGRSVRLLGTPLPELKGVTGRIATENAARSPKRTSATASAVVIGVALVVFITVFAGSATSSVKSGVERGVNADFFVTSKQSGLNAIPGIPRSVAGTVRGVPGVDVVSSIGFGSLKIVYPDGKTASHFTESLDPQGIGVVFKPRMQSGTITDLTDGGIVFDKSLVKAHHLRVGQKITVQGPTGQIRSLRLDAISDDQALLGYVALTNTTFAALNPGLVDLQVGGTIKPGADLDAVIHRIDKAIEGIPRVQVLDRDGFIGDIAKQITSYVSLIYGLLVISVITALVGIANTLSLSIAERTRELGLLRAVGMDRSSVRSSVRWEAVLIAALGAVVGVLLGLLLSVALVKSLRSFGLESLSVPPLGVLIVIVATVALGTLAAVRPARRAAGLSILDAIATE